MTLVFASPTYGPIDPQAAISHRMAIMHAAANGHRWLGDVSPDRMGWDGARNRIVEEVLRDPDPPDAVFWADSDVVLPPHAITSLAAQERPFISGLYVQRREPYMPHVYIFDPAGGTDGQGSFRGIVEWPDQAVIPVDAVGFGCVLTAVSMLRAIPPPHFAWGRFGEDFDLCRKAARAGFQPCVHTGVLCGHLQDPIPATLDDFRRAWKDWHMTPVTPPGMGSGTGLWTGPGTGGSQDGKNV